MTSGNERAEAEPDTLAGRIGRLDVAESTRYGELGVLMCTVRSLIARVAAGEESANTAKAWACKRLDKISQLWAVVEGLNWTFGGECGCVAGLVYSELL